MGVTDEDVRDAPSRLGFELHRSFNLLDAAEKSDYLRAELLYHHGGFYLDTDVFCLKSLAETYRVSVVFEGSAVENAAVLGPFHRYGTPVTMWHMALLRHMDAMTPYLESCAEKWPD